MPGPITMDNVEEAFGPVKTNDAVGPTIKLITERFTDLAKTVINNVPDCAHRSAALRELLIAKWTCIDAICKGGLI